jgi:hypothetical protein
MARVRLARIAPTLAALLLASTDALGQEWVPTKPVWKQASQVICREHRRYACAPAGSCFVNTGRAVFTVDFGRNEVSFANGTSRFPIEGRAFRIYPNVLPNHPVMSLLMGDGRLFKFIYVARTRGGPFDLHARILGHSQIAPEIEVFELTCARS